MLHGARTAVVIPALNEQAWIGEVVSTIPRFVDHVVVVDDGSSDHTTRLARNARCHGHIHVVRHAHTAGVGAAIASGYRRAMSARADVVAVMAGDGQMHPDDLEAVVGPVARGEADYVKGNRLARAELCGSMPLLRARGTRTLARLTSWAAGVRLDDSQCGYTAISRSTLQVIDLRALWPGYGYPNDLIGQVAMAGLRIAEVPVRAVYRGQQSGLRARHAFTIAFVIGRVALRRLSHSRAFS